MVAILSFLLGMSMTSCTDWLEMESYTSDDVDYIFENETKADLFVQGCYRGLIHKEMFYNLGMGETVVHTAEDGFSSKYKACNYDFDPLVPTTVTTIFKEVAQFVDASVQCRPYNVFGQMLKHSNVFYKLFLGISFFRTYTGMERFFFLASVRRGSFVKVIVCTHE